MASLENIPTDTLRQATTAWRNHDARIRQMPFGKLFVSEATMGLHEHIGEMVDEIARLRASLTTA